MAQSRHQLVLRSGFEDGLSYERYMGDWSRRVGAIFIDWLALPSGLKWIDVGCGNGAFTELIVERCGPSEVRGIDSSEAQLDFARKRSGARLAKFDHGDAMALPFSGDTFDVAIMALVIFFVPDPAKGVAEMKRALRPGGMVASYAWDILGGGFPLEPIRIELRAMGLKPVDPRVLKRLDLKPCVTCGLARVSRRSKRERCPYNGLSRTSKNFGMSLCRARQVSVRHWGRCPVPKWSCSKREFVRVFQAMP